jgi:hypothetical protein
MVSISPSAMENASRSVSRVLSVRVGPAVDDHSSGTPVAGRFTQPTRAAGPETAPAALRPPRHPYSVLLPVGFALPPSLLTARCALAAPFHPCARPKPGSRYHFCGTVPGVTPAGRYPAPCFHGARTFLPCALSGQAAAVIRPAGRVEVGVLPTKINELLSDTAGLVRAHFIISSHHAPPGRHTRSCAAGQSAASVGQRPRGRPA